MYFKYNQPSAGILADLIRKNNPSFANVPSADVVLSNPGTDSSTGNPNIQVSMATDANAATQYTGFQTVVYAKQDIGAYLSSATPAYTINSPTGAGSDLIAAVNARFMLDLVNDTNDPSGVSVGYDSTAKVLTLAAAPANLFWKGSAQFNVNIPQPNQPITNLISDTALYNNPLDPALSAGQTFAEVRYGVNFNTTNPNHQTDLTNLVQGSAPSSLSATGPWQLGIDMTGDAWVWDTTLQSFNINGATVVYNGAIQAGTLPGVTGYSHVAVIALDPTFSQLVGNLVIPYNTTQSI